jgi:pimeloyl-ACP methyl ester carboxylesterase
VNYVVEGACWKRLLPHVKWEVLDGVGHSIVAEEPEWVVGAIERFIDGLKE